MSTGGDEVSAEALGYEVENGRHLLARDVELLDDLLNAQILEVLDDGGHRQAGTLEHQAPLTLPGMLSTAGHWDQSSAAMLELLRFRLRQNAAAVTRAQAAARSPSICRNHPSIWFQLTKMRLTSFCSPEWRASFSAAGQRNASERVRGRKLSRQSCVAAKADPPDSDGSFESEAD
jgi:hypothetical protein